MKSLDAAMKVKLFIIIVFALYLIFLTIQLARFYSAPESIIEIEVSSIQKECYKQSCRTLVVDKNKSIYEIDTDLIKAISRTDQVLMTDLLSRDKKFKITIFGQNLAFSPMRRLFPGIKTVEKI